MVRRLPFLICGITLASLWACDSLSDPAKSAAPPLVLDAAGTQVSGTLVQTDIPADTRVALLWKTERALTRGPEAPVIGGRFTIELGEPPTDTLMGDLIVTDHGLPGQNTFPIARAGFVVYVDSDGNHQLDVDEHGTSSDRILGGNTSFVLTYVPEAPLTDYLNLRDDQRQIPHAGYNLMKDDGESRRWAPFDRVELSLATKRLPNDVCDRLRYYDYQGLETPAGTEAIDCDWTQRSYTQLNCFTRESKSLCADESPGTRECVQGPRILLREYEPMPSGCGLAPTVDAGH